MWPRFAEWFLFAASASAVALSIFRILSTIHGTAENALPLLFYGYMFAAGAMVFAMYLHLRYERKQAEKKKKRSP